MQFRLIHGTVAIIGDRAAVSDIAILTEMVKGQVFFLCCSKISIFPSLASY